MMKQLATNPDELISIFVVVEQLPRGSLVLIQPQDVKFLEITDISTSPWEVMPC